MQTRRSVGDAGTCTEEIARSELKDEDAKRRRTISKPRPDFEKAGCARVRQVLAVEDYENHPSSVMREEEIETEELRWMNIGSSIFARTFKNVGSLRAITKVGQSENDIYRRVVRSLSPRKVIEYCFVDDVSDKELRRKSPSADKVRVELTVRNALSLYQVKGADVVDVYSQPRIAQEASLRYHGGI